MKDPLLGQTLGRYEVLSRLGQGGVARVYRAVQQPLGREVALKLVRPDMDAKHRKEFESRFLREAALAGRLSHPNVVTVFDFGRSEDGHCYIAMELLLGKPLHAWLDEGGMEPAEVARIGAGIARGLRHAHQRGMVHRDVKPGNIFLVPDDEDIWQPRLLDFGLVKDPTEDSITSAGTFLGTPHYIAPEQAKGLPVNAKSDVYSLGVVLYRMICDRLPFEAPNAMAIALKHVREEAPTFAERVPGLVVDPGLEAIVRDCLVKDPDARIDANQLTARLDGWREGSLSIHPAVGLKPERSRGPLLMSALLALGIAGTVAGAMVWEARRPPPTPEPTLQEPEASPAPEASPDPSLTAPEATPEPEAPAPETATIPEPAALPPLRSQPKPTLQPPVAEKKAQVLVDEVSMTDDQARKLLEWVNTAEEEALHRSGIYPRGVNIILERRPFADVQDFANTPFIGRKSVESALLASE